MTQKGVVTALKGEVDRLKLKLAGFQEAYGAVDSIAIGDYILTRLAQLDVTVILLGVAR